MSTSSLRPMRKGGFVALSVITCVLALCDLLSGFFFYSYVQSEGGLGVTLPALEALVAPLLALAAAVLLLIATLSVQKAPKPRRSWRFRCGRWHCPSWRRRSSTIKLSTLCVSPLPCWSARC